MIISQTPWRAGDSVNIYLWIKINLLIACKALKIIFIYSLPHDAITTITSQDMVVEIPNLHHVIIVDTPSAPNLTLPAGVMVYSMSEIEEMGNLPKNRMLYTFKTVIQQ